MKKYLCLKDYHSTTDIINIKTFNTVESTIKAGDILMQINKDSELLMSTRESHLGISEFILRKNSDYFSFSYAF